jgi:hypothetical protein
MMNKPLSEMAPTDAALLDLGVILGQNQAFGLIAGRCSAAQAESLSRLRQEKLYQRCAPRWDDFCPKYLKISRVEADRTIKLWQEFGPAYFELSQLTRVSPETFRAIAPAIQDGALHYNGEAIELNSQNSLKVAAAVADLRRAIPKAPPESQNLLEELRDLGHEMNLADRIEKLDKCGAALVAEFERISSDKSLGAARMLFNSALTRVHAELGRVAAENGLA